MTNFKKVLSLSLASATLLSSTALATFSDKEDIVLSDAVDTLVALNIIKGYDDGTFRPEDTVTRAEMAKMIFTIQNGGSDDASAFSDISTSFTDINGHWAEGYVKYCQSQGIIAGKSDTIFDPDELVKGTEALKMSLVVLGYRADVSELIGVNWESKTLALSLETGLTADYIGSFVGSAERQSAAQILYNALYTETVKYSAIFEDYAGTEKTLAEVAMNLQTFEGVYIKDSDVDSGLSFTTDSALQTAHSASPLDIERDLTDYIGQKVDILADSKKDVIYGFKVDKSNKVIDTFANNLTVNGSAGAYSVTFDSVKINISDADATAINGATDNANVYIVDNGTTVATTVTEVTTGKVTFVNDSKINVATTGFTAGQLTFEDDNINSKIEKDDYVQIIADDYNNNYTVEILELHTGTVDAKRDGEFRIDNTWYTVATGDTNPALNTKISYYAIGSVIYEVSASETQTFDFAYVIDAEEASSTSIDSVHRAKIIFSNGSTAIVTTEVYEDSNIGKLVEYDVNSDNEYTFSAISEFDSATVSGNILEDSMIGGYNVSDDAIIFVAYDSDKYTVADSDTVLDWSDIKTTATSSNTIIYTDTTNGISYVTLAFINLGANDLPSNTGTETYAYVVENPYDIKENNTTYTVVTVFDGEDTYEIKVKTSNSVAKGDFVQFEATSSYIDEVTTISSGALDQITGYSESLGKIVFKTAGSADITSNTVIIYVDSDDIVGVESGSIDLATDVTGDDIIEDNVFVLVEDGKVTIMFIDVNNNMQ
ncbi:MAG: S-layer homology domain-containing protein [Clostridia bacterium]